MRSYTTTFIVFFSILLSGVSFGQRRGGGTPTVPTIILNAVIDHATCFNDVGCIDYTITTSSGWGKGWSVNSMRVYDESNTIIHTHAGSGFTGNICDLPVGRYKFIGSVTVRNSSGYLVSVPFTFYEWLGIEANWSELLDMTASPNSFSAMRTSSTVDYGGALSKNYIASGDAWIEMSADYGGSTNSHVYWVIGETTDLSSFTLTASVQYIEFYKTSSGSGIRARYSNGSGYWFATISNNVSDKVRLIRTGTTLSVQLNNSISTVYTFPQPYTGALNVGVFTREINDASLNVLTSFGCASSAKMYAHLKYKLDGFHHTMKNGEINFIFDQEYDADDLKFNIYNKDDILVKTEADYPPVSTTNGDNYLTIDISASSTCLARGFHYLEVINSKKEKMYLRFFNDYLVGPCIDYIDADIDPELGGN